MEDIQGLVVQMQQQDTWTWGGDSIGKYSVGNAYTLLNKVLLSLTRDEVFKAIWKLKIPSKASIFAWSFFYQQKY